MKGADNVWKSEVTNGFTHAELKEAQLQNPVTCSMIQYLKFGTLPDTPRAQRLVILIEYNTFLANDILYHLTENTARNSLDNIQLSAKIWIPRTLQIKAVKIARMASGQCGAYKTLAFIRMNYVFPKMYALTYKLALSCEFCNLAKRTGNALQMQQKQLYPMTHRVHYHCNADFAGPFVRFQRYEIHIGYYRLSYTFCNVNCTVLYYSRYGNKCYQQSVHQKCWFISHFNG